MGEHTEDFQEKLLKIEAESGMFELEVKGLRLWQYVRWFCLVGILYDVAGEGQAHIQPKVSVKEPNMNFKERIERQQFLLRRKDMIVLNHPRRVKEGKYYRCFVTETLLENLDGSYYVFENSFRGQHFRPTQTKNLKYIYMDNIRKTFKIKNSDTDRQLKLFYNKIMQIFEKDNQLVLSKNVKKEIFQYITNGYYEIYWRTIWAKIVFALVKPKVLLITSPYSPDAEAVIVEAKRQHITTIEMQHGIAKGHFFYNYLYQGRIDIFPDYIFAYSKHDREMQRYPIKKERIIPVGHPDLERKAKEYQRAKTSLQKTILFVSSTEEIVVEYAMKLRQDSRLKDMRIVYKLHPYEYGIWTEKGQYRQLTDSGIEIISENEHDIYFYLSQADYVVGNVSTALYEATEFETEIFIICGGNYKDSAMLYENGYAQLVTNVDMLADAILNSVPCNKNKESYFEKNAIENMKRELGRIMSENDERRKMRHGTKKILMKGCFN